ncbi:hypothetical protein [Pseudomonas sp. CF161]|uniref:hypothetical protein n=1 Tax=Pseudomonas sp. CF161 TaxID=911241 RepID=UPI000354FF9E|nr:hypothetical protein [Pseudomonas sp. CF161]EPL05515.1 hypothetical protein CF161_21486 [Pseudomonas sp. CF161]
MATFKFPFKDQAGKEVRNADVYYDALTMASSGYYPLGPSGVHCGIHYESAMANTLALGDGIGAIAKGEVVAYRVNRRYLDVRGRATPPMADKVRYSSGFVLTRHSLEYPAGNTLTYFCLAMHLRSFEEYERLGAQTKRLPYWTAKVYRVSEQADDKQDATAGSAATRMTGLRVRAKPSAGTTPILGILPHGARIIGREIRDKKWLQIQALIEGDMAPAKTGDAAPETSAAVNGWVFLNNLTAHGQVPDAFDEVVFPNPPLKVKAGALLGHLGEYQRIADPGSSRPMLHHEIIVGPDLPAYLQKSRTAAKSAKSEQKTLLRMAPSAQLHNAILAPAQSGLLSAGTVIELESVPPDDAVYVNVKPAATLQWIDRTAKLPTGAREAKLYRHTNTGAYTAADLIAEARRGTAGQAGATRYRGIFVDASDQTSIWIAKNSYRGLHALGKQKLLLADVAQGWNSYPLTFAANGHKNGAFAQHFAISTLEQARPATPDPASEPIGCALDEAGKRWWQVQLKDATTSATGWLGEENHPGISLHSPHEWVDFTVIESESQTPAYGSYFLTLAEMTAFQRGEKALQKNQLDTPLQEVFDTLDSHPDGALTLGELQAAQRSRSTLQRLSRIILRYPTEWKAAPQAWVHYDAEILPSNRDAWESEKQRMGELVWWDEVSGKIARFPKEDSIFHIHPVSFISNFACEAQLVAWGKKVTLEFKKKVIEISEQLNLNPDYLMSCMAFETGETFRADIKNAAGSGATGLIQFMPSTAASLGTTTDKLSRLSPVDQLDYVYLFFLPSKVNMNNIEDVYMHIFYQRAVGKPDTYTIAEKYAKDNNNKEKLDSKGNKIITKIYSQNSGLDEDNDGFITKREAAVKVREKYNKGMSPGYFG